MEKLITFASLALILAGATACRDPLLDGTGWQPDADPFDADVEDDAGPGALCPPGTADLFNNFYSPYAGGEDSVDLEVVNYSYFRCPHCAHFSEVWEEMFDRRADIRARVRLYFHHYPFNYESAWQLHAATVAAGNQGVENFWAVHDYIYGGMNMEEPEYYSLEEVTAFADDVLGLDMARFEDDLNDDVTYAFLQWDKAQAIAQEVTGTPSVFICGEKISWGSIEERIDGYLSAGAGD
jgi:protein-disulfide isomerase